MRILTFTTLYPNAAQPRHGLFVETRLAQLRARHPVDVRVVAPVPWFPFRARVFGRYADFARAPRHEERRGIAVAHPRYVVVPVVGMNVAPRLLARGALGELRGLRRKGFDFDLIDAHYFYPDGVAAAMIARALGKPLVITARGSDINLIARYPVPRRLIVWAARRADAIVTVCDALARAIEALGVDHPEIHTLRNGVDLERFRPPRARERLRRELGLRRRTLLSVGNLVELKGHHLVIEALGRLQDVDLVIVGDGPERARLERSVRERGLDGRVRLLGPLDQSELTRYYGAADALVLASSREGWANVLLEAMACGTPVVATAVSGTPEVVREPSAGRLASERTAQAIAGECAALLASPPDRAATRRYAERFSWDATSDGLHELFSRISAPSGAHALGGRAPAHVGG